MLNSTGRGLVLQSSHITNRQLIPNWGIYCNLGAKKKQRKRKSPNLFGSLAKVCGLLNTIKPIAFIAHIMRMSLGAQASRMRPMRSPPCLFLTSSQAGKFFDKRSGRAERSTCETWVFILLISSYSSHSLPTNRLEYQEFAANGHSDSCPTLLPVLSHLLRELSKIVHRGLPHDRNPSLDATVPSDMDLHSLIIYDSPSIVVAPLMSTKLFHWFMYLKIMFKVTKNQRIMQIFKELFRYLKR